MKKLNFEKLTDVKFKQLSVEEMQLLKGGVRTFVTTASSPCEGDGSETDNGGIR